MRKIYVFDTNVLVEDENSLYNYPLQAIVICSGVLEEIDFKRKYTDDIGRKYRELSCIFHEIMSAMQGGTNTTFLPNGSEIMFLDNHRHETVNHQILKTAADLKSLYPQRTVIIVTKDALLRVQADAAGLLAEDYSPFIVK